MRQTVHEGRVNYEPNSLGGGCPMSTPAGMGGFRSFPEEMTGQKVRGPRALEEAGAKPMVVSTRLGTCPGDGGEIEVDTTFSTAASVVFDAVLVAGGSGSAEALQGDGDAIHFVNEAFKHAKPVAAIGAGVGVLGTARLPQVELADAGDSATVSDQGVVTAGDGANPAEVASQFLQALAAHCHWGREMGPVPA